MFLIHTLDYFKDFNMILNDNMIDCFLDEVKEKSENDIKEIIDLTNKLEFDNNLHTCNDSRFPKANIYNNPKLPSQYKPVYLTKEKLNKNKIQDNNYKYNGYGTTRNVESFENYANSKNEGYRDFKRNSNHDRKGRIK